MGAVYLPLEEMVPPDADQVTEASPVLVTAAVNCWVWLVCIDTELGVTTTATEGDTGDEAGDADNEQPAKARSIREKIARIQVRTGTPKRGAGCDRVACMPFS